MGYGNPGGKSVTSKVPNVPFTSLKLAAPATPKAFGSGSPKSLLTASDIIKSTLSPINGYTPLTQSVVNQPTRTPGGAGLSVSPNNPTSSNSPGFLSLLLNPTLDPSYLSADDPNSTKSFAASGGATMGLLETAKAYATSAAGKQIIGGGVAALTSKKSTTTTAAGKAVNPRTGISYRHMNSLNPHALSRATRRIKSFTKRVKSVEKALNRIHTKR